MKNRNRRKLKRRTELERQIQSLRDQVNGDICDLESQVYEIEEKVENLKVQLFLLWSLAISTFALVLWHIISHFTV